MHPPPIEGRKIHVPSPNNVPWLRPGGRREMTDANTTLVAISAAVEALRTVV
jgi:hypothetical protein